MSVITRFAPSPTGMMHLGNARTALFNYLYARHTGGKFLLRIEDTDKERSTQANVNAIYDALDKMNIRHDGDIVIQSDNLARHTDIAHEMIALGMAYRAYDTKEELDAMREKARIDKTPYKYNGVWKNIDHPPYPADKPYVVRVRNLFDDNHPITINDLVQGDVTIKAKEIDDFIILRSDGTPTYLLSVVVDDHDAGVNTIIRGDDHLTNTFRQYLIFHAMGWDIPAYGHVPLIHGPDGAKLSKRHGAMSIEDLCADGFDMDGLVGVVNYLATLGWSGKPDPVDANTVSGYSDGDASINDYLLKTGWAFPKDVIPVASEIVKIMSAGDSVDAYFESLGGKQKTPEFFSMDELIAKFDINDVSKAASRFDMKKLLHINGHWMQDSKFMSADEFTAQFMRHLSVYKSDFLSKVDHDVLKTIAPSLQIRSKTFNEAMDMVLFLDPDIREKAVASVSDQIDTSMFNIIMDNVGKGMDIMDAMNAYKDEHGLSLKKVAQNVRLALTGQKVSPPMHDVIEVFNHTLHERSI